MTNFKKGLLLAALIMCACVVYPASDSMSVSSFFVIGDPDVPQDENLINITITINGTSSFIMKNVNKKGMLEVYGILGKRIKKVDLTDSNGVVYLDLSKGIYVFKVDKVTQKVVVSN